MKCIESDHARFRWEVCFRRLKSAVDIVDYRWSDVNEAPSVSGWMNYRHRNQQSLPGDENG